MEVVLAFLLACAIVLGVWGWVGRGDALSREKRLIGRLEALKRSSQSSPLPFSSVEPEGFGSVSFSPRLGLPSVPPTALRDPVVTEDVPLSLAPDPAGLLGLAQDHADALSSLRGTLLQQPPAPKATSVSAGSVPDAGAALPSPLSGPLAEATVAIEQFVDESSRLRSELHSNEAAAGRILEGLESALPRAREAAYESEALSPHVASLFGLADRLNLLSVNLTGGASPDPESRGPLIEASREIRELSEEARALSRNLGTRLRQATAAAHRSKDAFSEIGETARGVHERAHRALRGGERLAQLGSRLEGAFSAIHDSAERAGRELEELSRSRGALEARIAVERGVAADRGSELASRAETIRLVLETIEKESAAADRLAAALGERRMTGTTPDRREA